MGDITPGRRVAIGTAGGAGGATAPLFWLLDGADSAGVAAACLQAVTGVVGFLFAVRHRPSPAPPPQAPPTPTAQAGVVEVVGPGDAVATAGGTAVTGFTGPAGGAGARVERTGNAEAHGPDSTATTGLDTTGRTGRGETAAP
ncbi:hypothetical protein [Streptomyces specialis]|uniref:hypothetical protein n=1 Tax=Streptomyces specialis TaxID=498367 RepID=UPI00073F7381|nr:hypothetical protein [Streptomyces specialis]